MNASEKNRWVRKSCWLLFACLTSASASFAQEGLSVGAPNISIIKLHWGKQVRLPRNFDPSIIPTDGAFSDPASRSSIVTATTDTKTNSSSARNAATISDIGFPATPARLPVFYVYSMKIRNTGSKAIEGVAWDYLFIDPNSNTELGRHQFVSYAKISIDKTVTLQGLLRSSPIRVVRTPESSNNTRSKFIERVVIQCVLYADDTAWRNLRARKGVCEFLKNEKTLLKRKRGPSESQ